MHGIIVVLTLLFASLANVVVVAGYLAPASGTHAPVPAIAQLAAAQKS